MILNLKKSNLILLFTIVTLKQMVSKSVSRTKFYQISPQFSCAMVVLWSPLMILNPAARVRVLSRWQYTMRLQSLHRAYPSLHHFGVVHWVPEQLNIKGCNWGMQVD